MAEAERFPKIEAEFCLAEGGSFNRQGGKVTFASIQTLEKIPRAITLTARGTAGHGSVPLRTNAVVKLTTAVSSVAKWKPPISFNETTAAYFKRLASISDPAAADRYRAILSTDAEGAGRGRRVLPRQRAAPRLDHPHVDLADDDPGRLPHQRHPVGSAGHARRAHDARPGSGGLPRDGEEGRQRPDGRGDLRRPRRAAQAASRGSTPTPSRPSKPTSRSTTT